MKETINNKLKKPDGSDFVKVQDLNVNWDSLDTIIGNPNTLNTESKSVVAAINEVNGKAGSGGVGGDADTLDGKHASDFIQRNTTGQTMTQPLQFQTGGGNNLCGIYPGNRDGVGWDGQNLKIKSWQSIGFDNTCPGAGVQGTSILFDVRAGSIATKGDITANGVNLNTEINALKSSVSNGKTLVANAITAKGVATSTTAEFATMANNINSIAGVNLQGITNFTTASDYPIPAKMTLHMSVPIKTRSFMFGVRTTYKGGVGVRFTCPDTFGVRWDSDTCEYSTNKYCVLQQTVYATIINPKKVK